MKILCISDLHFRDSAPRYRIDDYRDEQFRKLKWILNLAKKEKCDISIQAGDFFDSVRSSYWLINDLIELLRTSNIPMYAVAGNHDLRHRSLDLTNTPIKVLESAGVLNIIKNDNPIILDNVHIYGVNYGEPIPDIQDSNALNILVIHLMIIKDDKLYPGQECATGRSIIGKNKFDLIVSADNHNHFISEYQNRVLLNLGSLMRSTIKQLDHQPKVAIFDTSTKKYELFEVPIESSESVFNLELVEKNKDYQGISESIKNYIDILGVDSESREWDFAGNIDSFIKNNNVNPSVVNIINQAMRGDDV